MQNYNLQDSKKLNKDYLIGNDNFIKDAKDFLIERSNFGTFGQGYDANSFKEKEAVYDAFMEHFRRQNVNEFTATKDLTYAQTLTDNKGRARMGRLMDTFDKMDSDFGWKAAGDYLGGVFTAPSTYAGIFSFGTAKAGALAAQQGVKFGIRQALAGAARGAIPAVAIDAPVAAGTILAQEATRKATIEGKDDIDFSKVGAGAAISAATSGILGGALGAYKTRTSYESEKIVMGAIKRQADAVREGHEESMKVFNDPNLAKQAKKFKNDLLHLEETIPEELAKGRKLKEKITKEQLTQNPIKEISITMDAQTLDNIAAAGAKIYDSRKPRIKEIKDGGKTVIRYTKGSKEDLAERFSSRITRALLDNKSVLDEFDPNLGKGVDKPDVSLPIADLESILRKHNVSIEQLGMLYAAEISEAGKRLGSQSKSKRLAKKLLKEMNTIDGKLQSLGGNFTSKATKKIQDEKIGLSEVGMVDDILNQLTVTGRVGLMTVQSVTTARNTTNGYLRNYLYALTNLGEGLVNVVGGNAKRIPFIKDEQIKDAGRYAVRLGVAQLKTSAQALLAKDLVLGTTTVTTDALDKMFRNPIFGKSDMAQELFKEMGDIGNLTGAEGGLVAFARYANYLNTLSDNMFKRAIFARELNMLTEAEYGKTLRSILREGDFKSIDDRLVANAMESALDFTYQQGKFHRKEGAFNSFANLVMTIGKSKVGSIPIPFPKYLINQFRFLYEHTPLLGMFNFGGILNKATPTGSLAKPLKKSTVAERLGKQIGGTAMLYGFLQARSRLGTEDTGTFEYKNPYGQGYFDLKATLGPFAMTAWYADFIYRMMPQIDKETFKFSNPLSGLDIGPKEIDTQISLESLGLKGNPRLSNAAQNNRIKRDFIYAATGGLARAGTASTIIDTTFNTLLNDAESGMSGDKFVALGYRTLADYLNSYTVGAGVFKDMSAIIDPDFRKVPNNTDVSLFGYFAKQATRSFPQTADTGDFDGLDTDVDGMNILGYNLYNKTGPRRIGFSATPYRTTGMTYVNPLLKQSTGFFEQEEKTFVQKELDRLGFDYTEVVPRTIVGDTALNNDQKQKMALMIEKFLPDIIRYNTEYRLESDQGKRNHLRKLLSQMKVIAREATLNPKLYPQSLLEMRRRQKATFDALSKSDRLEIQRIYKEKFNDDLSLSKDYSAALSIYQTMKSKEDIKISKDQLYQSLKGFKGFKDSD